MKRMKYWMTAILILGLCMTAGCTKPVAEVSPTPEVSAMPTPTVTPTPIPTPVSDSELVRIRDYIPDIQVDLRYATENNFTGQVIYDFSEPWLRYGTVKKLMAVQEELHQLGYGLLIWDGYRPPAAQFKLWEIVPDGNFVANPYQGFSSHSRGNTVDLTMVTLDGQPVEMPSAFDEFAQIADRDYSDVSDTAEANAQLLESIMQKHGFDGYFHEWWHYSDTVSYEAEEFQIY